MHRQWNNILNKDSQNKIYTSLRSCKEFEFKVKKLVASKNKN